MQKISAAHGRSGRRLGPIRRWLMVSFTCSAMGIWGCQVEDESRPHTIFGNLALPAPGEAGWSGPAAAEAEVPVARVNGVPIFASWLHHLASNAGQPIDAALDSLVEFEVLAQYAFGLGYGQDAQIQRQMRLNALQQMLHESFVRKHGMHNVRDEDYRHAYNHPTVRIRFDHQDMYRVLDYQLLCCSGDWRKCEKDREVQQCIDDYESMAMAVAEAAQERAPFEDNESFWRLNDELKVQMPHLAPAEFAFWYQHGVAYEDQRGYDKYHPQLVDAIVRLEVGQCTPATRSPHGWHVSVLRGHRPAKHLPWDHPDVKAEIGPNIYPFIQKRDYEMLVAKLFEQGRVQIDPGPIQQLFEAPRDDSVEAE